MNQSMFDWNGATNPNKDQYKVIDAVKEMAKMDYLDNGIVMDLNTGVGESLYLYYNGSFYPTDRPVTKGWDAEDIYQQKIPHPKPKNSDIVWYPPTY